VQNVGTILISCNPYKALPLYTPAIIDAYRKRGSKKLAPHVFEIADDSFRMMLEKVQPQSMVISGESGAGKTECTKQALQYLAEIAGSANGVEQRILYANPILEAFGNAKTVRNNNSSRFGKYIEISFDKDQVRRCRCRCRAPALLCCVL
jgi:myosin heavy subunit